MNIPQPIVFSAAHRKRSLIVLTVGLAVGLQPSAAQPQSAAGPSTPSVTLDTRPECVLLSQLEVTASRRADAGDIYALQNRAAIQVERRKGCTKPASQEELQYQQEMARRSAETARVQAIEREQNRLREAARQEKEQVAAQEREVRLQAERKAKEAAYLSGPRQIVHMHSTGC